MTATPKFRVAVIGAGIGGLSSAIAFARFPELEIQVYESAPEFREIGAGIAVWRRPYHVMQEMGLENVLQELFVGEISEEERLAFVVRKADQEEGVEVYAMTTKMGALPFHRADLQQALARHLQSTGRAAVHLNKRLVSYEDSGSPGTPVKLHFKDGTTAECDLLVGADGIHSTVRKQMLTECANQADTEEAKQELLEGIDPMWSGCLAYRAIVSAEGLEAKNPNHSALKTPHNYMGKHMHMIVFPMAHNGKKLLNVALVKTDPEKEGTVFDGPTVEDRPPEEIVNLFVGWEQEAVDIVKCIKSTSRWVVNAVRPLSVSTHGRVALLGDAAHAMTPHQGSGAGQAIEDGYVLAALLAHPLATTQTLPQALYAYQTIRLPRANEIWRLSRENGLIFDLADPRFADLDKPDPDLARFEEMMGLIKKNWEWAWTTEVSEDRDEALRIFEAKVRNDGGDAAGKVPGGGLRGKQFAQAHHSHGSL